MWVANCTTNAVHASQVGTTNTVLKLGILDRLSKWLHWVSTT